MRSTIREAIETVALAIFLVLVIQAAVQNYRVEGPSMEPRLLTEDRVIVNKVLYTEIDAHRVARFIPGFDADEGEAWTPFRGPDRGDVVVFKWPRDPRQNFVKRIVGLPGDVIRFERGTLFVNDEPQIEPYIESPARESLVDHVVAADSYYVLGDNRAQSDDSRHWGDVKRELIIGKVWVSYWPLDHLAALFSRPL
jgi:signal peptidase I